MLIFELNPKGRDLFILMKCQFDIRIFGRVQGVGFRAAARNQARSLKLHGWVENLPDGSVRAVVSGEDAACHSFLRWCREGSGYSWTERVEVKDMETEVTKGFYIKY